MSSEFEQSGKRKRNCISRDEEATAAKSYKCRFCPMKFDKSQALGGHMNRHRQEREREQLNQARQLVMQQEFPSFVLPGQGSQYSSFHQNHLQAPSTTSLAYNAKTMNPPGASMLKGIPYGAHTSPLLASSNLYWNIQPSLIRSSQSVATPALSKTSLDLESSPHFLQSKIFDASSNTAIPFNTERVNKMFSRLPAEGAKQGFGSSSFVESCTDTHDTNIDKSSKRHASMVTLNPLNSNSSVLTAVGSQHEAHYAPPFAPSRMLQPASGDHVNLDSFVTAPELFSTPKMNSTLANMSNEACGNHFEGLHWMLENEKDTGYGQAQPDFDTNLSGAVTTEAGQSGIVKDDVSMWDSAQHSTRELNTQVTAATLSHSLSFPFDYQGLVAERERKLDP